MSAYSADLNYPEKKHKLNLETRFAQIKLREDKNKENQSCLALYQNYYGAIYFANNLAKNLPLKWVILASFIQLKTRFF